MIDQMVTVIIPVYNAEKYLERTIRSILLQTYLQWELILVDDCSTDQSRLLMQKYENSMTIFIVITAKRIRDLRRREI